MIRPSKHLNLDVCVIRLSAHLLKLLKQNRLYGYNALRDALNKYEPDAEVLFIPTVHFLFLLGRLIYHPQTDSFEYIEAE